MKKVLIALLLALGLSTVVGCGGGSPTTGKTSGTTSTAGAGTGATKP